MATPTEHHPSVHKLLTFLARIPAVKTNETPWGGFGSGIDENGWWVKFWLDIDHHLAWSSVQEIGHVLNELSVVERLPTIFKPVSPPPYLNGGPREYLAWVIECRDGKFKPGTVADWLEGRLPTPVDDIAAWPDED
ncbi:hypothetical protein [Altererythrobacter sp. Root672]|uniref:hypothetical protein n=1 Tax=Altererythrobacter sp. Root672 TaxID=1736584 RepID=UPI0006FF5345|nr:hypothetical protein [Altererythrobacter sp. Root672]KRA79788.1 hypothetical protein ASD76_17055 [Altererythrobacter sp. Root672]